MNQPVIHRLFTAAALGLTTLLSACGSDSNWPIASSVIKTAIFGKPDSFISRESLSKIPYAMITARVGKRPPAILVLAASDGSTRQWMATNEVSVVTHNGRIVQTVGFALDVRHTELFDADPLSNKPHLLKSIVFYQRTQMYRQEASGPDRAVSLRCSMKAIGPTEIEIAEIVFQTILMEENCRSGSGKKRKNLFWIDPYDGFTWQSRQKVLELYPAFSISVLKPES